MGNGQCERFNQTLIGMLRTMADSQKSNWKSLVNKMTFAYNSTRNDATGFSPFELLFGRKPRLPIDIIFGETETIVAKTYPKYLKQWRTAMEEAHRIAAERAGHSAAKGRKQYDKKVRTSELKRGDRVLVKNLLEKGGPGKLRSFWETIYEVVDRKDPNNAVYTVKPLDKPGRQRVLHCNLLLPCPYLPYDAKTGNERSRAKPQNPHNLQKTHSAALMESAQQPVGRDVDQDECDLHHNFDPNQLDAVARLFSSVTGNDAEIINHEERTETEQVELPEAPPASPEISNTEEEQDVGSRENSKPGESNSTQNTIEKAESSQNTPQPVPRPQRIRRPPTMLTYYGMGVPQDSNVRVCPLYPSPVMPPMHQQPLPALHHFVAPPRPLYPQNFQMQARSMYLNPLAAPFQP